MRRVCHVLRLLAAVGLAAAGCRGDLGPTAPQHGSATMFFEIRAPAFVRLVSVQVTGAGIDSLLAFNIAVDSTGHGSGSIRVAAGSGRHVVGRAFDANGVNTHLGDTTLTLLEGTNAAVPLLLRPLVGTQPIVITIGTPRLSVLPNDTTTYVSDTVQFAATVRDTNGAVVAGALVEWATSNPTVATVDGSGRVVGRSVGVAGIVAISGAYAARRQLTVVLAPPDTNATFVMLSTAGGPSGDRSCGVTTRGNVLCWGSNEYGVLGNGTAGGYSAVPVRIAGGLNFLRVTTGPHHSCALTTDGTAYCWGRNQEGQLGDSTVTDRYLPTPVRTARRFVRLDAGSTHTCALDSAGTSLCWGDNDRGEIGDSSTVDRLVPTQIWGAKVFREISAADHATMAIDTAGHAWCWGFGPLGASPGTLCTPGTVWTYPHLYYPSLPRLHGLALGETASFCVLGPANEAYCTNSIAGGGDISSSTFVAGGLVFASIGAGNPHDYIYGHACAATVSGALYCWGTNSEGQAGPGTATIAEPVLVPSAVSFAAVSANGTHTCVLGSDGHAYCMGANGLGQLGDGTTTSRNTPTLVRVR